MHLQNPTSQTFSVFFNKKIKIGLGFWVLNITIKEFGIKIREVRECGPSWLTEQAGVWAAA